MEIQNLISSSIAKIINYPVFDAWSRDKKVNQDDYIAINNSFVHRDLNTLKSKHYLVLKCINDEGLKYDMYITSGLNLKADFVLFSSRQPNLPTLESLSSAIESQIDAIGFIVYGLIGYIQDDVILSENFGQANFSDVIWNQSQNDLLSVDGTQIIIKDPYDEDALWNAFQNYCAATNRIYNVDVVKQEFGKVLDKLQGEAEANLKLPDKREKTWKGLTDAIVEALKEQRVEYDKALSRCKGVLEIDPDSYNQVLRISYNFASDAIPYLRLVVSICDLKPIILWATIGEHYLLSEALRELPWTRSRYKPSLKNYIDIIGDARNSVFHNIFPFHKALRFLLPSGALQKAELRIFSEYSSRKNNNELTFQDKELIDILLEFTRSRQRPVSPSFWEKNADVMDRMIELFEAISRVLKMIYSTT